MSVAGKASEDGAPFRHPLEWENPDFYDMAKIEAEMHRVFDICHGCRRCFNLCDSFPRLFDLIDESATGELDSVPTKDYKPVVDACTLCDMCFMTKCPYVPPHEFNLDFPHLMLRYRAAERRQGKGEGMVDELAKIDRNGKLGTLVAPIANWAMARGNGLTRPILSAVAGVARDAELPRYAGQTFQQQALDAPEINAEAPAHGRKAVLYASCYVEFHDPGIGRAARAVLAHNGVETEVAYPECCGMPQLEQGELADVAGRAKRVALALKPYIDQGYRVIAPVPSCALMLKFEWPLLLPDDPDVRRLSQNTSDISEYVVDIARKEGLAPGLESLPGGVTVHIACHARAQNMGQKAAELLKLLPETKVEVVERCSGHGGSWGVREEFFEIAIKVGKPVARQAAKNETAFVASECPLAATHILQGIERLGGDKPLPTQAHPIELFARAYGLA
ncbi:MAG TPA: heterodisulfide reductase-related iron-sulfur binding cluster [Aliidongia sp.]|nr:heterodisulfide reductase-related iron-sulfur binding cluster [Aliidongia sp.]